MDNLDLLQGITKIELPGGTLETDSTVVETGLAVGVAVAATAATGYFLYSLFKKKDKKAGLLGVNDG